MPCRMPNSSPLPEKDPHEFWVTTSVAMWPPHEVPVGTQGGHATSVFAPSSHVMMTMPSPCVYHFDASTVGRLFASHVSPCRTKLLSGAQRLCMSSHTLGVIQTKSGGLELFRSDDIPARANGTTSASHSEVLLMICLK